MFLQRSNSIHTKVASKQLSVYWPVDMATTDYAWFYEIIGYLISNPLRVVRLLRWRGVAFGEHRRRITLPCAALSDRNELWRTRFLPRDETGGFRAGSV
jgi:hypothetical protein